MRKVQITLALLVIATAPAYVCGRATCSAHPPHRFERRRRSHFSWQQEGMKEKIRLLVPAGALDVPLHFIRSLPDDTRRRRGRAFP